MNFANAFKDASTVTLTENGAVAYNTTGNDMLDLFSTIGSLRSRQKYEIEDKFARAFAENPLLALKCAFYCGDIRGGLGERRTFRIILKWLANNYPEALKKNIGLIEEYNRWDSIYVLFGTPLENEALELIKTALLTDYTVYATLGEKAHISLLAKWLPSINTSSRVSRNLANKIRTACGMTQKEYRQTLSTLRAHLNIVERKMSAKEWETIDFDGVPSYAMKKYRKSFERNSTAFSEYMQGVKTGSRTIHADTLFPYDIVREYMLKTRSFGWGWDFGGAIEVDDVLEAQWKALPDMLKGRESNIVVMADTSGSMFRQNYTPISSAIGLATYFAQRNKGAYHGLFMNFSSNPTFHHIRETDSLAATIQKIAKANWGMSTNLAAAFESILNLALNYGVTPDEMPKALLVISDMEIDYCGKTDFVQKMERLYNTRGYELPKLIFWNVNSRHDTFLTKNKNVLLVSGNSTATFKHLIDSLDRNAYELMESVLLSERYAPVTLG